MTAKAEIFAFLAVKVILAQTNAQIIVTKGDEIVWSLQKGYVSSMQSEEADTRMFVHIKHASLAGSQINVILDTHVVVMRFDLLFARC